jgi:serine/threonine-protein kinase
MSLVGGGRYRVVRPLGRGGMATVELAEDVELGRTVAIKLLAPELAHDEAFRRRFLREARIAAKLAHPNVVRVYDVGETDGRPYLVMEYVDGEPLDEIIRREGRLAPSRAALIAAQAAAGLAAAHSAGLVHRDVKPANVLVAAGDVAKLADFGIALGESGTRFTEAGTVVGSAAYLAPERLAGAEATPASDVYSLGAVLYELLTAAPPRQAATLDELATALEAAVVPVRDLAPDAPPELEELVMRCLARLPAYRPPSAAELASELRSFGPEAATRPLVPSAPTVPLRRARPALRRPVLVGILVALTLAAAAIAVAVVVTRGGGRGPSTTGRARPIGVRPVPASVDPVQQARNLSAWLRANAR